MVGMVDGVTSFLSLLHSPPTFFHSIDAYVYGTTRNVVHSWVSRPGNTTLPTTEQSTRPTLVVAIAEAAARSNLT